MKHCSRGHRPLTAATVAFLLLTGILPLALEPHVGYASHTQCSDGQDNDHNGRFDFPQDYSCDSLDDPYEGPGTSAVFATITDGREEIRAGDTMIYVITLLQQREDLRDVSVDFHVPSAIDLLSADRGGLLFETTVRWDHLALQNNVPLRLTVQARVRTTARISTLVVARVTVEGAIATDVTRITSSSVRPYEPIFRLSLNDGHDFIETQAASVYVLRAENRTDDDRTVKVQAFIPDALILTSIPSGAEYDGHTLTWPSEHFDPRERREFAFAARIPERLQDYRHIFVRARVGADTTSDTTVILTGFPANGLSASISSDRTEARRGDAIQYRVVVRNDTTKLATAAAVDASLPLYGEFINVTEGGFWDGRTIHWRNLQIAPRDERTLTYAVRVRSDAPTGARLLATAATDGSRDSLTINVVDHPTRAAQPMTGRVAHTSGLLLRKVADRSEILPGGTIRYTITVQNVLLHTIHDAVVTDRFDPQYLSVTDHGNAERTRNGALRWTVPVLKPGQSWQTSYTLGVSSDAPNGFSVSNIARITGNDVNDASFSERVTVTQAGVMTKLPSTGAPLDALLSLLLLPFSLAPALVQRRFMV